MRIGKIASSVKYRIDEPFRNCPFLELNCDFPNGFFFFTNLFIFQFGQFQKFPNLLIWKLPKVDNLENSKNLQFAKFLISESSENFLFEKFTKFSIRKSAKI